MMATPETQYLMRLKLRVGTRLATKLSALGASILGKTVKIASADKNDQPLSEAHWVTLSCGGFETESDAASFGEELRRAAHMAGLCSRVGIDAGDPGETVRCHGSIRTTS